MENKKKRVCKGPYKKWTDPQQQSLVSFLKENRPLEKPTAQKYYGRFLEICGGKGFDWKHVRNKVRHMRSAYSSVKSMLNSTGAGAMEGETIDDVILAKCPQFHEYEDIFGYREETFIATILDSGIENDENNLSAANVLNNTEESEDVNLPCFLVEEEIVSEDLGQESMSLTGSAKKNAKQSRKGIYSRTGLADVLQVQSEILDIRKSTKEAELKLKEEEVKIQREKLQLEKEKQETELSLAKEKIVLEKDKLKLERTVKFMEIKMKREIAMKEIEMKERVEMEKLKKM